MNTETEIIDRPKVIIAVLDGEFVGFARKADDIPSEIMRQQAVNDAHLSKQNERLFDQLMQGAA